MDNDESLIRKSSTLNGAHTLLVAACLLLGIETVGEAMETS